MKFHVDEYGHFLKVPEKIKTEESGVPPSNNAQIKNTEDYII